MLQFWQISRHPSSGVEMTPEIGGSISEIRVWKAGHLWRWRIGRFRRDLPGVVDHHSPVTSARAQDPNRG